MTPSHHGLGSVVLCTLRTHTVAVYTRQAAGTVDCSASPS